MSVKVKRLVIECECGDCQDCKDESQLVDVDRLIEQFEARHAKCDTQSKLFPKRRDGE